MSSVPPSLGELLEAANAAGAQGRLDEAEALLLEVIDALQGQGDAEALAGALLTLARCQLARGELSEAVAQALDARALAQDHGLEALADRAELDLRAIAAGPLPPFADAEAWWEAERDWLLGCVSRMLLEPGPLALPNHTQGISITQQEVAQLLEGPPAPSPALVGLRVDLDRQRALIDARRALGRLLGASLPADRLEDRLGLTPQDRPWLSALLLAARDPQIDRAFRHLWSDLTLKQPPVHFLGALLATHPAQRRVVAERLLAASRGARAVRLLPPRDRPQASLYHHEVELDPILLDFVEGRPALCAALEGVAALTWPQRPFSSLILPEALPARLVAFLRGQPEGGARLLLLGGAGAGKASLTQAAAAALGAPLLTLRGDRLSPELAQIGAAARAAARDALLHGAVLYLDLHDELNAPERGAPLMRALLEGLGQHPGPVIFGLHNPCDPLRVALPRALELPLRPLEIEHQVTLWRRALGALGATPPRDAELQFYACQAGLNGGLIERAAQEAVSRARFKADSPGAASPDPEALRAAVRNQHRSGFAGIAHRISTLMRWTDLVVRDQTMEKLQEVVTYARYREQIYDQWGFRAKVPYGRSLSVMFVGPPGTGKTMTAGILARELGVDLFRVDLSQIVSKYIGETEKNLARLFDQAAETQAMLLFDEADSLFAKRTSVKSSNDRYANLEINFLLQRMEAFEGVTILTTNMESNIDDAFKRRVRFTIDFPFPDPEERALLWQTMIPPEAEVDAALNLKGLAEVFEMSGAHIKSAVIRAAFMAAERGESISERLLFQAARREYKEMGKLVATD